MKSIKLYINGMSCSGCASAIENALKMRNLVKDAKVDYNSKIANIKFDEMKVKKQAILKAIKEIGYKIKGVR